MSRTLLQSTKSYLPPLWTAPYPAAHRPASTRPRPAAPLVPPPSAPSPPLRAGHARLVRMRASHHKRLEPRIFAAVVLELPCMHLVDGLELRLLRLQLRLQLLLRAHRPCGSAIGASSPGEEGEGRRGRRGETQKNQRGEEARRAAAMAMAMAMVEPAVGAVDRAEDGGLTRADGQVMAAEGRVQGHAQGRSPGCTRRTARGVPRHSLPASAAVRLRWMGAGPAVGGSAGLVAGPTAPAAAG